MAAKSGTKAKPGKKNQGGDEAAAESPVAVMARLTKPELIQRAQVFGLLPEKAVRMTKIALAEYCVSGGVTEKAAPLPVENQNPEPAGTPEPKPDASPADQLAMLRDQYPTLVPILDRIREKVEGAPGLVELMGVVFAMLNDCRAKTVAELKAMVDRPNSFHGKRLAIVLRRVIATELQGVPRDVRQQLEAKFKVAIADHVNGLNKDRTAAQGQVDAFFAEAKPWSTTTPEPAPEAE